MPVFLALVLFEKYWGWRRGRDTVRTMDMISSLSSGVTNVTKDVLGLSIALISYQWMVSHFALMHIQSSFVVYLLAFIALDFAGYWTHRVQHVVNFFWNGHIIHHSSEEFNLACALRQSIAAITKLFIIFLLPAALLGVPANVIAVVAPLHLFAQFWYHTQHINKMGWLEHIIVTPSHHRVHHAINKEYIDKNYGQIFIIWDKLFGSFQPELADVQPVYGITRPARTWNPVKINYMHLWLLIKDAWHTKRWQDKARIWFMPTGWRPEDVKTAYPVYAIEDVYQFDKYNAGHPSKGFAAWIWCQMIILLLLVTWLFSHIAVIGSPGMFVYGAFIFLYVYALTELMDGNRYAFAWELAKALCGIGIIYSTGDWFGASSLSGSIRYLLLIYFAASALVTTWFCFASLRKPAVANS
ncbi:MAG TPA: sterol desaturase family protein [Chitinophagaceae bacterium]|nr:sterol desaturase family protein [Chitinophagaceae bacterium]